jgi:hypothetical protein
VGRDLGHIHLKTQGEGLKTTDIKIDLGGRDCMGGRQNWLRNVFNGRLPDVYCHKNFTFTFVFLNIFFICE